MENLKVTTKLVLEGSTEKSNNILVLRKSVLNNIHIICGSGSKEEKRYEIHFVFPYMLFWTISV